MEKVDQATSLCNRGCVASVGKGHHLPCPKEEIQIMHKRILILAPFYPPNLGGAETFAEGLAHYLAKDHDVVVLAFKSFDGEGIGYEIFRDDLRVIRIDWAFKRGKAWSGIGIKNAFRIIPKMLLNAWELQKEREFDIVLCNGLCSACIGAILKVFFKVRVGCILLALYGFTAKFSILGTLAGGVLKRMDKIYLEGEGGVEDILPLGVDLYKMEMFQHWVDQRFFKPESHGGYFMFGNVDRELMHKIKKSVRNDRKIKVLFVGRPLYEKGIDVVRKVEQRLKGEIDFEYIEDVPHEELAKHYQMADVLIVPSLYAEGFVRVVAEGASCGCAVIVSDRGSLPEMVKGFGIVFDPSDYHHLLYLIEELNKNRVMLINHQNLALEYARKNFTEKNAEIFSGICS